MQQSDADLLFSDLCARAEIALNKGDRRGARALINRVLQQDITCERAWRILHDGLAPDQNIEVFRRQWVQTYFPERLQSLVPLEEPPTQEDIPASDTAPFDPAVPPWKQGFISTSLDKLNIPVQDMAIPPWEQPASQPPLPGEINPPQADTSVDAPALCPNCGNTLRSEAQFCNFCGHCLQVQVESEPQSAPYDDLEDTGKIIVTHNAAPEDFLSICPDCKHPRGADHIYCENCGFTYLDPPLQPLPAPVSALPQQSLPQPAPVPRQQPLSGPPPVPRVLPPPVSPPSPNYTWTKHDPPVSREVKSPGGLIFFVWLAFLAGFVPYGEMEINIGVQAISLIGSIVLIFHKGKAAKVHGVILLILWIIVQLIGFVYGFSLAAL